MAYEHFQDGFIFAKINPRELVKLLCRLLVKVNHALVTYFYLLTLFAKIEKSRKCLKL